MPISATGKAESGFTLLEVLAVLVLIGLVTVLAFPQFRDSEEKAKVQLVGKLIQTDLRQLKEAAISDGSPQTLSWDQNGYRFQVGEQTIVRAFDGFTILSGLGDDSSPENQEVDESPKTTEEPRQTKNNNLELQFSTAGICTAQSLQWETPHFRGKMDVSEDGTLGWSYERR